MTDQTVTATALRAGFRRDTPFVADAAPRLSWRTETGIPGWTQRGAELEATIDGSTSTASVDGRDSVFVAWPFAPLAPRQRASVRVRVTGADGSASDWSEPREVVGDSLAEGEWAAPFIGLDDATPIKPGRVRREFEVRPGLAAATLYATGHGVYQAHVNGSVVDDEVLKPGWTSYQWRLVHETTDVTALLREGANAIGVEFAGCWYTETYGWGPRAKPQYGDRPAVAAQLVLDYADGSSETILTGAEWAGDANGPRTASGLYAGEDYDARKESAGWAEPGFDAAGWAPVRVDGAGDVIPGARSTPPVRRTQEVAVQEVITTPSGATVVDFGQNLVGRLRIRVSGEAGAVVTLKHAEVLEHDELGTRPLRRAKATDTYTLAGGGVEVWEPEFTFHGFRYAQLDGWPGEFDPADVTAVVIHSDMERTGWFETDHALLNRFHENVVWGMRGNFVSVPTDCPQRDERLGWTGDIEVFAPTASFLFDSDGFLSGWLEDVALEQAHAGGIAPFVVPMVLGESEPAAAWGDATCIVPMVLFERFGDLETLRRHLSAMRQWADLLLGLAGDRLLWEDSFQFGDWLDPDAPPESPADAKASKDLVASAYLYRSVDFTARAAELVGDAEAAAHYGDLARRIKDAFLAEYVTESGRMLSDAQTDYALGICFGLYATEEQKQRMGERLAFLTRAAGYHIGTGFVGTPLIMDALTETGHLDAAARLMTQTENPSWLYSVSMGATTVWERWDSMLEDGTINPGEMTSFNHYALGAVADWLERSVAGLGAASPGYRELAIEPHVLPGLNRASARHLTPYGEASAAWERTGDRVVVTATVPANTTATVTLPDGATHEVGAGSHSWEAGVPPVAAPPSTPSLSSPMSEIVDDPEAYAAVVGAVAATDPEAARGLARRPHWTPGSTIEGMRWGYAAHFPAISSALEELAAKRAGS